MELLLRFLVFSRRADDALPIEDIGEYLNDQNRILASDPKLNRDAEARKVDDTFALLRDALGTDAFRKFDPEKKKFLGGFLVSAYEAVAMGVAANVAAWRRRQTRSDASSRR